MKLVCLDTQIIIWGVKGEATQGQEHMPAKAKAFIAELAKSKVECIIPAIAVAECLFKAPQKREAMLSVFNQCFRVAPFDLAAAEKYVSMYDNESFRNARQQSGASRETIRIDGMIVAIAVANKAECIYSDDEHVGRLARGHIECKTLASVPQQLELGLKPDSQGPEHHGG